jgi:short-subunit dehydrogenase
MQHVFITGGTKGIGRELVTIFLQNGFKVSTCARSADELEKLVLATDKRMQSDLAVFPFDLTRTAMIEELVQQVMDGFGPPSILINNAGIYQSRSFLEEDITFFDRIFSVNYLAPYRLCQLLGARMVNNREGLIINICSTASSCGIPEANAYVVSKHALLGMTRTLREEWKKFGIRVSAILPGSTFTSSWEGSGVNPDQLIQVEDITKIVLLLSTLSPSANVDEVYVKPFNF